MFEVACTWVLQRAWSSGRPAEVSLGPRGECFARWPGDNQWAGYNFPPSLDAFVQRAEDLEWSIRSIVFGDNGTWLARYES